MYGWIIEKKNQWNKQNNRRTSINRIIFTDRNDKVHYHKR